MYVIYANCFYINSIGYLCSLLVSAVQFLSLSSLFPSLLPAALVSVFPLSASGCGKFCAKFSMNFVL